MNLLIAASAHHRRSHAEDALRGGGPQLTIQLTIQLSISELLFLPVASPAREPGFQGTHGFLERLFETTADGHRFAHRLH